MLAGANIPLNDEKNKFVGEFLCDHTRNAGAIPKVSGLTAHVQQELYKKEVEQVSDHPSGKKYRFF